MPKHYNGKLFSEYKDEVNILIRLGRLDEAEKLLRDIINTIESEEGTDKCSTLVWYYSNLANIYHERGDLANEKKTLEAFARKNSVRTTLHERLESLKGIKA